MPNEPANPHKSLIPKAQFPGQFQSDWCLLGSLFTLCASVSPWFHNHYTVKFLRHRLDRSGRSLASACKSRRPSSISAPRRTFCVRTSVLSAQSAVPLCLPPKNSLNYPHGSPRKTAVRSSGQNLQDPGRISRLARAASRATERHLAPLLQKGFRGADRHLRRGPRPGALPRLD